MAIKGTLGRVYGCNKEQGRFKVTQTETLQFEDENALKQYLGTQEAELERLRAQKEHLSKLEQALVDHVNELKSLLGGEAEAGAT